MKPTFTWSELYDARRKAHQRGVNQAFNLAWDYETQKWAAMQAADLLNGVPA